MKLEIRDLHVSVNGKRILNGISLHINPGEIHALMGPNGGGKSTLSAIIAGHPSYKIEQGDILLDGKSILARAPHERAKLGIFLSFQNPIELAGVSFAKFLLALAKSADPKRSPIECRKLIEQKLAQIGLEKSFLDREVNVGLSGGEKKRAELLQLLTLDPKVAILDELDSGLDVDSINVIAKAVNALRAPTFSALIITHYPKLLELITPDVVHILSDGKIVATGPFDLVRDVEKKGYQWLAI